MNQAFNSNLAAHVVHTTDSTQRRLSQPDRSIPWAALIVALCAAPLLWAAVETGVAYLNGALP